jgi:hypothetical protein
VQAKQVLELRLLLVLAWMLQQVLLLQHQRKQACLA